MDRSAAVDPAKRPGEVRSSLVLFAGAGVLGAGGLVATHVTMYYRYQVDDGASWVDLLGPLGAMLAVAVVMGLLMRATWRGSGVAACLLCLIGSRIGLVGFLMAAVLPVGLVMTGESDGGTVSWLLGTAVGSALWGTLMVRAGWLLSSPHVAAWYDAVAPTNHQQR